MEADRVREKRRTSVITMITPGMEKPDIIEVCEPDCRNDFLLDLGIKGGRGAWVYSGSGEADVMVEWQRKKYHVSWKRRRLNAHRCDACVFAWRYHIPPAVAAARAASEARKGVRPPSSAPLFARRTDPEPRQVI